jgi:predicted GNAT family N-acyltransferase
VSAPRLARGPAEVDAAIELRVRVFCEEQGVDRAAEVDGLDDEAVHIVAMDGAEAAATCRLRFTGSSCKLERMAVARAQRGGGMGAALLAAAEEEARRRGATEVVAHAQVQARGFYERGGFAVVDPEVFLEDGIEHVKMARPTSSASSSS